MLFHVLSFSSNKFYTLLPCYLNSYRILWTQNPICLLTKFSKILFNIIHWANFQNTNVGDYIKLAKNGKVTPHVLTTPQIYSHMHLLGENLI
jgi:hypothetical protein